MHKAKKLKALEQYLKRQRLFARRICQRYVYLYNAHDVVDFMLFLEKDFANDVVIVDHSKAKNFPIGGIRNSEYQLVGLDEVKNYFQQVFCYMPDGCLVIQSIREKHKGSKVTMRMTVYGTLIRDIILPEDSIASTASSNDCDNNKDVVRMAAGSCSSVVKNRISMQIVLDDKNKVQRIDMYAL